MISSSSTEQDVCLEEEIKTHTKTKRPPLYKVLLHNDDYTTMEFVIRVIRTIFGKTAEQAHEIMMMIHTNGIGVCGIYTKEIAETKVQQVIQMAKREGQPLKCSMEAQ